MHSLETIDKLNEDFVARATQPEGWPARVTVYDGLNVLGVAACTSDAVADIIVEGIASRGVGLKAVKT
jgi:hypothetical protein